MHTDEQEHIQSNGSSETSPIHKRKNKNWYEHEFVKRIIIKLLITGWIVFTGAIIIAGFAMTLVYWWPWGIVVALVLWIIGAASAWTLAEYSEGS